MSNKHLALLDKLEQIFLSNDRKDWIEKEPNINLTNLNAGITLYVEPVTALSIDEVEKFTIVEDVDGIVTTTFLRKKSNTRDPARIERMLKLVKKIWSDSPDLRLTQLIMNALRMNSDPYYIEDDKLEDALKSYYEKREI
jgi:hypothetical protein